MARGENITAVKFRLSHELNEQIERAAEGHGWGVSEEIRRRLEASFAGQPTLLSAGVDAKVHEFVLALSGMVQMLQRSFGDNPAFMHAALRSAIDKYLRMNGPQEAPETVPNPGGQYGPLYNNPVTVDEAAATAAAAGQMMAENARKP
jgi:hypothetical protein